MNRKTSAAALTLACFFLPALALAHVGSGEGGIVSGLLHPFTGLDHLLTALACGVWMRLRLDLSLRRGMAVFLLPLLTGMLLGANGIEGLYLETLLGASVLLLAVLLAPNMKLRPNLGITLASCFALLQGLAHGGEIIRLSLQGSLSALAVSVSTGLLLMSGYLLAGMILTRQQSISRSARLVRGKASACRCSDSTTRADNAVRGQGRAGLSL
ncbi:HupE/UreJ family protein [Thiolapillus sp.]